MRIRSFVVACLALGIVACEERSPVAPLPQSTTPTAPTEPTAPTAPAAPTDPTAPPAPTAPTDPPPPAAPPPIDLRFIGVVHDSSGRPIAGASITFWPPVDERFSDQLGQFPLPVGHYLEAVFASKPGYESTAQYVSNRVELALPDIIRIAAGQSARVTVGPNDSIGGYGWLYRVRTIRVISGGDRIVRIQVLADDNGPVDYRVQNNCGDVCPPNPPTFFLEGGGERQVTIQVPWQSTVNRTFTVVTSAEDP